jgi:hypothetical protein
MTKPTLWRLPNSPVAPQFQRSAATIAIKVSSTLQWNAAAPNLSDARDLNGDVLFTGFGAKNLVSVSPLSPSM